MLTPGGLACQLLLNYMRGASQPFDEPEGKTELTSRRGCTNLYDAQVGRFGSFATQPASDLQNSRAEKGVRERSRNDRI